MRIGGTGTGAKFEAIPFNDDFQRLTPRGVDKLYAFFFVIQKQSME